MVRQHDQLYRHESEQTLGDSEGQESLVGCNPGVAKSRTRLNNGKTTTTNWVTNGSIVSFDLKFI